MMTRQRIMGDVLLNGMERVVKARRDKYGATGHAHQYSVIFVTLYNNNSYFSSIVRGRFRVGVGVDINKTQSNW